MKIAVVGGGVSGLSTLWALNEYSDNEVHLFEGNGDYIGGHTNTVKYEPTKATKAASATAKSTLQSVCVDTGFIVFNTVTYPNFLRFVKHIGVEILESDMSFAVTRYASPRQPRFSLAAQENAGRGSAGPQRGYFEWAGTSPSALFCQVTNLFNPEHWRMVWDIIRFNNQSLETLRTARGGDGEGSEGSIGEYLDERGYGEGFRRNYLIPMTASIWSTPPSIAFSEFPAITLLRFMHNHHLLQILNRPQWLTLKGGSRNYVEKILGNVHEDRLHHGPQGQGRVVSAKRDGEQWTIKTQDGRAHTFDKVVFATHADTALSILDQQLSGDDDDERRDVLGAFQFSKNEAVLHSDTRLLPVARNAWAAWNFLAEEASPDVVAKGSSANTALSSPQDADRVSLTYWMNLLQSLPESQHGPVLVTLNPPTSPAAAPRGELIAARYSYEHPVYTAASVNSQRRMQGLQGRDGLYFAGAWLNYGFHEDGFKSGLEAAHALGAKLPFEIKSAEREIPKRDTALLVVNALERARRVVLAPLVTWFAFPLVVVTTSVAEVVLQVSGLGTSLQGGLRRVRVDWEDAMQDGRDSRLWAGGAHGKTA